MSINNQTNTSLQGQSGSGSFAGTESPVFSQPSTVNNPDITANYSTSFPGNLFSLIQGASLTAAGFTSTILIGKWQGFGSEQFLEVLDLSGIQELDGGLGANDFPLLNNLMGDNLVNWDGDFPSAMGSTLASISFPALTNLTGSLPSTLTFASGTSVPLNGVISIGGSVSADFSNASSINLTGLQYLGGSWTSTPPPTATDFNLSAAITIAGSISFTANVALNNFITPSLVNLGSLSVTAAGVNSVDFSSLAIVSTDLIANFAVLGELDFPAIVAIGGAITLTAPNMTDFSLGSGLLEVGGDVTMTGMSLDQPTVDGILVSLAALDGTGGTTAYSSHTVNLSGGSSSAPSATGVAAKVTLVGRSCTVTTN